MLIFLLRSTSDDRPAGPWTRTASATPNQPKNEMLIFVLHSTSDDWLAGRWTQTASATPLQPKNEMLVFGLRSTSDDRPGWSMDSNPIHHPFPAKKGNARFWITFNF